MALPDRTAASIRDFLKVSCLSWCQWLLALAMRPYSECILYPPPPLEWARVLRPKGVCVVLTTEIKLMRLLAQQLEFKGLFRLASTAAVDIGYVVDIWRLERL